MPKVGDGTGEGTMPTSHEGSDNHALDDMPEGVGGEFYTPSGKTGGPKLAKGGNRSGPLPGAETPFYSGGKKAERGD